MKRRLAPGTRRTRIYSVTELELRMIAFWGWLALPIIASIIAEHRFIEDEAE